MNSTIILRPVIGAVIGYITNWIAVKMMFRPLYPVKIGKWTLPFTPGIIPKNKDRIADSIGNVISENLLNEQVLKDNLLSEKMEQAIKDKVEKTIDALKQNHNTIENQICSLMNQTSYDMVVAYMIDSLSESIYESVQQVDIGTMIAKQIEGVAIEKLNGSLLGMFGGSSIVTKISDLVRDKANDYIEKNGKNLISDMVEKEINKMTNTKVSDFMMKIETTEIDLVSVIMKIYQKIVMEKLSDVLNTIQISKIVSDKIKEMDLLELEKLLLAIMKKELNALVNLGAVIGFILGLLNLLF